MKEQLNSNKIFIVVIALLLLSNIATLTMLFWGKKPQQDDRRNAMRNYLIKDVRFNDTQLAKYDSIKTVWKEEAKTFFDSLKVSKQANLKAIGKMGFSDSSIQEAAIKAANTQQMMEANMLQHLKYIRNLCTKEQLIIFDTSFFSIMTKPFAGDSKK